MQRRTFLQGLIVLAVAMRVPLRPTQAMPTVTLGGDDYGWLEYGIKDGVAYHAQGIGDTAYVLYVTADGQARHEMLTAAQWGNWRTA